MLVLESDPKSYNELVYNRDINKFNFHIENSALSKRSLIQMEWNTIPSDEILDGYYQVKTITWRELQEKFKIDFDTLILDCEGAFYYILTDMPEILNNINLICMENDYKNYDEKIFIDKNLIDCGFTRIYSERYGWGPCQNFFYEAWKKI